MEEFQHTILSTQALLVTLGREYGQDPEFSKVETLAGYLLESKDADLFIARVLQAVINSGIRETGLLASTTQQDAEIFIEKSYDYLIQ